MNWDNDIDINKKKILCFNILNNKKCNYGNKCMYAHSLNEQKMEPIRHKAYTIIKFAKDLSNIDFIMDPNLYETMLQLTKVCSLCNKNQCPGGYNCRNGVVNIKYKICYDDLVYGNCKRPNCQAVHLTERGLMPYIKQKSKYNFPTIKASIGMTSTNNINTNNTNIHTSSSKSDDSQDNTNTDKLSKPLNDYKTNRLKKELDDVQGILLTENFLFTQFGKTIAHEEEEISGDEGEIDEMIRYLNNNNSDSDEESIFLV